MPAGFLPRLRSLSSARGWAIAVSAAAMAAAGCTSGKDLADEARRLTGGAPEAGRALVVEYGCVSCHAIDGVPGARGRVAPPLNSIRDRSYVGGVLPNGSENLVLWIQAPKSVNPLTARPDLRVSPEDARHIASFLYSLDP